MSRSPQEENRMYDPWTQARDPAADAEMDAEFDAMMIAVKQKLAMARESAIAAANTPLWPVTQQVLFKTKTGKVWKTGQDVECLATELNITTGEAEALLTYGQDAGQILTLFGVKETWKKIRHATDRVACMREVIKNRAAKPTKQTPPPVPLAPLPFSSMPVNEPAAVQEPAKTVQAPAGPVPQAPAAHEPAPPTGTETDDSNRARRDRILTKAFDHMGRGQIGNNTYTLMDFSNYLDMKTDLWNVRMHLYDMIRRGLVRLVGPGVYAAVPECLRPPVPQDACEHEEVDDEECLF